MPAVLEVARRLFTVEEFERIGQSGVLAEDDRVELLDGELVRMNPIGILHAATVQGLTRLFAPLLVQSAAELGVQNPLTLGPDIVFYPDLMLLRPRPDGYRAARPTPDDVLLLVEVSDTTLGYDLHVKVPRYARAGVREIWVANLGGEQLLVHREPTPTGYTQVRTRQRGDHVTPGAFPDLTLAVADILG